MARPRFAKLDPEKQRRILDGAAQEFAEYGFAAASYNRIIATAQVSKGAMYYYFDDKEDLFFTLLMDRLGGMSELFSSEGLVFDHPEAFWQGLSEKVMEAWAVVSQPPENSTLARVAAQAWGRGEFGSQGEGLLRGVEAITLGWLRLGQGVGAIRTDLPESLLLRWFMALGEASDMWVAENWSEYGSDEIQKIYGKVLQALVNICRPVLQS